MSGAALREAERLKDLRRWLERHTSNPELPRRHSEYYKNEQILKHLLRGTDSEENLAAGSTPQKKCLDGKT